MGEIEQICDSLLSKNQEFVLATMISRHGSVPRMAGTKMIIVPDGKIYGTIGGGLLEARTIEVALTLFSSRSAHFIGFDLTSDTTATMDMICGGKAEVLLDVVAPTHENRALFTRWEQALKTGQACYLATIVQGAATRVEKIARCLLNADGSVIGEYPQVALSLKQVFSRADASLGISVITHDNLTVVLEPAVKPKAVYIFGAGHVAQPTAQLASMVGFRVSVLDDREEFASAARFQNVADIRVIRDFRHACDGLPIDENAFVIILTRGHVHDATVLAQALKTNAGYIGMIGSRRKRDLVYHSLKERGFIQEDFNRVHAPIGLSIGAETPEEIAVSIVAELIQKRAQSETKGT